MIEAVVIHALLLLMALVVVVLGRSRNLFSVVVLGGVYSFMMATVLVALDAVDVSMTEASVGAGISTVLFLGALYLCDSQEAKPIRHPWVPAMAAIGVGVLLVYGSLELPMFGDANAPIHQHVAPAYLQQVMPQTNVPNVVTAVLASYRGYDTLGETTVVFTAGAGVLALLRRRRHSHAAPDSTARGPH